MRHHKYSLRPDTKRKLDEILYYISENPECTLDDLESNLSYSRSALYRFLSMSYLKDKLNSHQVKKVSSLGHTNLYVRHFTVGIGVHVASVSNNERKRKKKEKILQDLNDVTSLTSTVSILGIGK